MKRQSPPRTYFSGCFKLQTSGPPEDGFACTPDDETEQLLELLRNINQRRRLFCRLLDRAAQQCSLHELSPGDYILVRYSLEQLEAENLRQQAKARRLLKRLLDAEPPQ